MKSAKDYFGQLRLNYVCAAMMELCEQNNEPDRLGGVLSIMVIDPSNWVSSCESRSVGQPGVKIGRYMRNSNEKVCRLHGRRLVDSPNETAASVSADPNNVDDAKKSYGGCIVAIDELGQEVYISFSGAPPDIDEALCYVIAEKLGLKTFPYENQHLLAARALLKNCLGEYVPDR